MYKGVVWTTRWALATEIDVQEGCTDYVHW